MPDKGWRRHFEEPIPLPDEMAAKAAQTPPQRAV